MILGFDFAPRDGRDGLILAGQQDTRAFDQRLYPCRPRTRLLSDPCALTAGIGYPRQQRLRGSRRLRRGWFG